jgi:hypothetical protein
MCQYTFVVPTFPRDTYLNLKTPGCAREGYQESGCKRSVALSKDKTLESSPYTLSKNEGKESSSLRFSWPFFPAPQKGKLGKRNGDEKKEKKNN